MTPDQIAALPYRDNVGVMLINADKQVWVGQRIDSTFDAWQMPQGGIDKGEDPLAAGLRELEEETGIPHSMVRVIRVLEEWVHYDLPADLIPKIWGGKYRGQRQKWVLLEFLGQDTDVNIQTDHPEFNAWKWLAQDQLVDAIVPFKRDVYAAVLKGFADDL